MKPIRIVHCRVGSSEGQHPADSILIIVHCRVGSSEVARMDTPDGYLVHCRVGSSEGTGILCA